MENKLITKSNFNTNDLIEISKRVAASGLLGSNNENQIFTLMMLAYKDGTNPVQASMDYHIIQGKPALSSQATLVRFQKAGGKIQYITRTDTECTIEFYHAQAGELTITWNMERAKQAGLNLNKQNWKQYPRQMLAARCIAEGVRALYPACLDGLYLVEEVQDFNNNANSGQMPDNNNKIDNSVYDINQNVYINYDVCPIGNNQGKLWKDLDIGILTKALDYFTNKDIDKNYSEVIAIELDKKLSINEDGKKWTDMPTAELEKYYKDYKSGKLIGYAEERANYIEKILLDRQANTEIKENIKELKTQDITVSEDENPFEDAEDEYWDEPEPKEEGGLL